MSKHVTWFYKTKEAAEKEIEEHINHPYVSLSPPIRLEDDLWVLNVTLWECD